MKKKAQLLSLLEEKKRREKGSPIEQIEEHKKQQELTNSDKSVRVFFGGNRTGKTFWGAAETARFLHKNHPAIEFDDHPMEVWACAESYDVHKDVNQPLLKKLLDPSRILDESFIRKDVWSEIKYRADDGTIGKITFKSYDQGRRKFQGAGKQLIWFDEEPPRDIWEECFVRVEAGRQLYRILTMTPVLGMTWVYDELYLATNNPHVHVVVATWEDNPWLTVEQQNEMARGLTEQALQVRREGKFVRLTGLVCPWWQRDTHLTDIQVSPEWDIYRAIDFGFSNPTCVLYIGVDYDDNWYIFDGLYQEQLTTPKLAEIIRRKDQGRRIAACWADSAQMSDIQQLSDENIDVIPVVKQPKNTKESWDEYRARELQEHGQVQPGTGKPKIFVSNSLVRYDEKRGKEINWFVDEVEHLKWDEVRVGGETEQRPRWKGTDHAMDALTYFMVSYRGDTPKPPERNPRLVPVRLQSRGDAFSI